jgi:FAD/FMN-containing dehydrogenase
LVIDLSPMNGIRVDPQRGTVRAEGGVTIGELDHETQAFGVAVPMGVVTATGIAGLTLGGGLGWLRRRHGLSCDNLISADLVTADGQLVTADEQHNPELLWALRGGGGNFGVVTSFEYRAHPLGPQVYLAFIIHSGADAAAALHHYRDWAASAPDEVSSFGILWHAPEMEEIPVEHHHTPIAVYLAVHCGEQNQAEQDLEPLRRFVPFLAFDAEIRKIVCTTNAIESVNSRIRRALKARGHFPNEQAALKCVNMAIMSLDPTGTGRRRWSIRWKPALNAFDIAFDGRLSAGRK